MKRFYAGAIVALALAALAFYSSWRVERFAREISASLADAAEAVLSEDYAAARESLITGADECGEMRGGMGAFLRTEDFTELEASLRAAEAFLQQGAADEAYAEVRRAEVAAKDLEKLAKRFV